MMRDAVGAKGKGRCRMWVAIVVPLLIGAFALVLQQVEAWLDRSQVESPATVAHLPATGRLGGRAVASDADVGHLPVGVDPASAPMASACWLACVWASPSSEREAVVAEGVLAETAGRRPPVVEVGAGFACYHCVRTLESRLPPDAAELVAVNPADYMPYVPLLPEVAAATLEPRRVAVPLRARLPRTQAVLGNAAGVDLAARPAPSAMWSGGHGRWAGIGW